MANPIDDHKQHLVLSFSRWDLKQVGIPEQQVDDLTDQDIQHIVEELRAVYREAGYMEALSFYAKFYLVFRNTEEQNKAIQSQN
jgi:hypothetical protein